MTQARTLALLLVGPLLLVACGSGGKSCREDDAVCVWAGTGEAGFNGDGHALTDTRLYWPMDVGFGPDGTPWVVDFNNHKVREVLADGSMRTAVSLFHPTDVVFGPDGLIYIADWHNYRISTLDPTTGLLQVLGGDTPGFAGDGGPASGAQFNQPDSLAFAPDGSLYVLDQLNQRIRRVAVEGDGTVTTVVGTGEAGFGGDGGEPGQAMLHFEGGANANPSGAITIGPDGKLYIADALNYRIRRVDLEANLIETIAGSGVMGFAGDGGPALEARLGPVNDLEFGPDGRLYLADTENNCIRVIDLATGIIGMVWDGNPAAGTSFDDAGVLKKPGGIAFSPDGYLYVADTYHHRIVRVALPGTSS